MSRLCDAFKCGSTVASGRFLCIKHWRMVAVNTQRTINSRYRACRGDFGFLSDVAYLQACVDAITDIATTEGFVLASDIGNTSAYGRLLQVARRRAAAAEPSLTDDQIDSMDSTMQPLTAQPEGGA